MIACTFFGHRHIYREIENSLRETIINLIEKKSVELFYVGNQGEFDFLVKKVLIELKKRYSHINFFVVLAYFPTKKDYTYKEYFTDTIYPVNLESVPRKFAISQRNRWMINKSQFVVTYVEHIIGGAAQFKELAEKKRKTVINIL